MAAPFEAVDAGVPSLEVVFVAASSGRSEASTLCE